VLLTAAGLLPLGAIMGQHLSGIDSDVAVIALTAASGVAFATAVVHLRRLSAELAKRQLIQDASSRALYDPLTDLANRNLFNDRLAHALASIGRHGRTLAVITIDLDGFNAVNDTFGQAAGDTLLAQVAGRLRGCVRPMDTVARLGGDEFGILLEQAGAPAAMVVARRIVEAMRRPFLVGEKEIFTAASMGIAESGPNCSGSEEVLRNADAAIYVAKQEGTGSYQMYRPEFRTEVLMRFELATDLRRAVERQEFILYYQPIVFLETGKITGLEALIRWPHPERGLISPADFIPIAEEMGLIGPIDQWVLAEACTQARRWQRRFPSDPPLSISVNVSAKQLQDPELTAQVQRTLGQTGVDPSTLTLEITENVLMRDTEATLEALASLKDLGVKLAIDDFGIGFSSLSYLRRLPVDTVKIDRSFVSGVATGSEEWTLARGIIRLVHGLGLLTVAEGVERADQRAHLRALGCGLAQGYYFARPMPQEGITALLEEARSRTA
jgi:diguanylate cyclase (GGDEF)-like protein